MTIKITFYTLNRTYTKPNATDFMTKYENVKKLSLKMKNDVFVERLDCEQILKGNIYGF